MGRNVIERRAGRRWRFTDIVTEAKTGRLSGPKIWANVGSAAMTLAFLWVIIRGGNSEWLWLSYGSMMVGHDVLARKQQQDQQKLDKLAPEKERQNG